MLQNLTKTIESLETCHKINKNVRKIHKSRKIPKSEMFKKIENLEKEMKEI